MSWQKVKLKEVLKQYRVQHIVQDDIEYKQVTISKYDGVSFRGTKIGKDIGRKRQFVIDLKNYPNTLMLVRQGVQDGSIGIAPLEVDGCIATENMPMFSIEGIDLEYLRFLLKSPYFYDELNKIETTGSAQKSIHERQILEIEIPLPNLEEQKQFVKELTKVKNGGLEITTELAYQLDLIKQLRQAFLREAMQGKLVKSTNTTETGQQLLEKIKAEKAQFIADKKLKKEKELPPITEDEIPFEIPEHWTWCRLGEICNKIIDCPHSTPKYLETETGFFGIDTNCIDDKNQIYRLRNLSEDQYNERTRRSILVIDDIIFAREGSIGKAVILKENKKICLGQRVMMFRPSEVILPKFLLLLTTSPNYLQKLLEKHKGMGAKHVNVKDVVASLIPLPPLQEQAQIVAKLEELMAFCDGLEQSIKESQGYNEKLLQQVLREALQGEK